MSNKNKGGEVVKLKKLKLQSMSRIVFKVSAGKTNVTISVLPSTMC